MKDIKGTLIYQPRGAAGEYAKWAVNLYNGCSNGCTYCYNRRGILSHAFGDQPVLAAPIRKKAEHFELMNRFRPHEAEDWRYNVKHFEKEAVEEIIENDIFTIGPQTLMIDGGVFMSFKCDPLSERTTQADSQCRDNNGRARYCRPSRRTWQHHTAYSI